MRDRGRIWNIPLTGAEPLHQRDLSSTCIIIGDFTSTSRYDIECIVTSAGYNVLQVELYWDNDYKSRKAIPYSSGFADAFTVSLTSELCRICHQCVILLMCVSFFDFQCVCQILYILSEEWCTVAWPAIVLDVKFDTVLSLYKIQVASMGQGTPAKPGKPARKVSGPLSVQSESIVLNPAWPMPDAYFYAFPRAPWFYCLPHQV